MPEKLFYRYTASARVELLSTPSANRRQNRNEHKGAIGTRIHNSVDNEKRAYIYVYVYYAI